MELNEVVKHLRMFAENNQIRNLEFDFIKDDVHVKLEEQSTGIYRLHKYITNK